MSTALTYPRATSLDRFAAEIKRYPVLKRDEELALARRYRDDNDLEAAHALVVHNLRFVLKVAHEYKGYGLKLADLVQEGSVGLMHAVKKFDPERGFRLISYAVWWIRSHIQAYVLRSWSLVKLGTTQSRRKLFFKLRSTRNRLAKEYGEEAVTSEALAKELDVPQSDVEDMSRRLSGRDASLNAPLAEETTETHLDMLTSEGPSHEDELGEAQEQHQRSAQVHEAMNTLSERERYIVEQRLMTDEPKTLQALGDEFKVSRERVRQLESRALKKLRSVVAA